MISSLGILTVGFFLGVRHATDADHVVAISTIVGREPGLRHAGMIGAAWGIGHTLTVLAVGGAIVLFSIVIPPRLGLSMDFAIGGMLVLLGALSLRAAAQDVGPRAAAYRPIAAAGRFHPHRHGDDPRAHVHGHGIDAHGHGADETPQARPVRRFGTVAAYRMTRPLVIGIMHGLAGSAAIALLLLTTLSDPLWAFAYLMLFGVGTILGMMALTLAMAAPMAWGARRYPNFRRGLSMTTGAISLGLGIILMFQIGFVHGLFGPLPQWMPG